MRCTACNCISHSNCTNGIVPWTCIICTSAGDILGDNALRVSLDSILSQDGNQDFKRFLSILFKSFMEVKSENIMMKNELKQLKSLTTQQAIPTTTSSVDSNTSCKKSVIFYSDAIMRDQVKPLRSSFAGKTKGNKFTAKSFVDKSGVEVIELAIEDINNSDGPLEVILHVGQSDCLNLERKPFLCAVEDLVKLSKNKNCSISVVSIPNHNKECKKANSALESMAQELDFTFLQLAALQTGHIISNSLTYTAEIGKKVAFAISKKVSNFLDLKIPQMSREVKKPAARKSAPEPTRVTEKNDEKKRQQRVDQRNTRPKRVNRRNEGPPNHGGFRKSSPRPNYWGPPPHHSNFPMYYPHQMYVHPMSGASFPPQQLSFADVVRRNI